jgi:Holliday junction DNA helicase RuvA
MLSFVKGTLVEKMIESPRGAYFLVDVHGMGMEVLSSQRSIASSPQPGEQVQLFTTLVVREDAMFLVGFNSREERDLFNILQSASGVGVKVALALLSALSVSEIAQAVVSNHYQTLTKAKGVGNKLAQKMALELKEKMMNWRSVDFPSSVQAAGGALVRNDAFLEAESVLLSLGYQPDEITRSFKALQEDLSEATSEEILRESLRWLAQTV